MKDIVLSCDNLLKQYPVKKGMFNKVVGQKNIVDHVSLELEKGKTLAIVGESGCGKTVLTRVLLGIEDKTDGSIVFEGKLRNIGKLWADTWRTEVSYLKENPWTI